MIFARLAILHCSPVFADSSGSGPHCWISPAVSTWLDACCLFQAWLQTWTLSSHPAVWRSSGMPFLAVARLACWCGLHALARAEALGVGYFFPMCYWTTPVHPTILHCACSPYRVSSRIWHCVMRPSNQPLQRACMPWLSEAMIPSPPKAVARPRMEWNRDCWTQSPECQPSRHEAMCSRHGHYFTSFLLRGFLFAFCLIGPPGVRSASLAVAAPLSLSLPLSVSFPSPSLPLPLFASPSHPRLQSAVAPPILASVFHPLCCLPPNRTTRRRPQSSSSYGGCGATAARLTPDQKVGSSSLSALTFPSAPFSLAHKSQRGGRANLLRSPPLSVLSFLS